mmetsp:Transcript_37537/g.91251  ORF Transcript_37537/g.91251 Transcript_37537/m.91251 type:complete len:403 (+) Transcript_37537:913-2121(+)
MAEQAHATLRLSDGSLVEAMWSINKLGLEPNPKLRKALIRRALIGSSGYSHTTLLRLFSVLSEVFKSTMGVENADCRALTAASLKRIAKCAESLSEGEAVEMCGALVGLCAAGFEPHTADVDALADRCVTLMPQMSNVTLCLVLKAFVSCRVTITTRLSHSIITAVSRATPSLTVQQVVSLNWCLSKLCITTDHPPLQAFRSKASKTCASTPSLHTTAVVSNAFLSQLSTVRKGGQPSQPAANGEAQEGTLRTLHPPPSPHELPRIASASGAGKGTGGGKLSWKRAAEWRRHSISLQLAHEESHREVCKDSHFCKSNVHSQPPHSEPYRHLKDTPKRRSSIAVCQSTREAEDAHAHTLERHLGHPHAEGNLKKQGLEGKDTSRLPKVEHSFLPQKHTCDHSA